MNTLVFLDFETYSDIDISEGPTAYVCGDKFRPVILGYAIGKGPVRAITDFSRMPEDLDAALKQENALIVAHNTDFDLAVFERVFKKRPESFDTQGQCRYLGTPAGLNNAGHFLGLGGKIGEGKALLKKLKKLKTQSGSLEKKDLAALIRYCRQDVALTRKIYFALQKFHPDDMAKEIRKLHDKMNRSGIAVNALKSSTLDKEIKTVRDATRKKAIKKFGTYGKDGKPVASSADQVKKFLNRTGLPVLSIAEKDFEDFLSTSETKLTGEQKTLIGFFRELQSRGGDKVEKLANPETARIFDHSIYHGAHTGRPTGSGLNLLNVKRYTDGDDGLPFYLSIERIKKEAKPGEKIKRLSSLLWGCLYPDPGRVLVRSDLSAIEPRVGAWLRDDQNTLDLYARADAGAGKDEYTIFGEAMNFPKKILRNLSKIVILAACYGMGPERLRVQCRSWGIPDPGEAEADRILKSYHNKNPSVIRAWFDLVKAAVSAIEGDTVVTSQHVKFFCVTIRGKKFLRLVLPSGRIKTYADVKLETAGTRGWKTFSYIDPLKNYRTTVRAAGLYENIVQAVAADVCFYKALQIQKFADVKLSIYDELNVSIKQSFVPRMKKIMTDPVDWLPGMPVNAKTAVCSSFHKGDIAP